MFKKIILIVFFIFSICSTAGEVDLNNKVSMEVVISENGLVVDGILYDQFRSATTYSWRMVGEDSEGNTIRLIRDTYLNSSDESCLVKLVIKDKILVLDKVYCFDNVFSISSRRFTPYMYIYDYNMLGVKAYDGGEFKPEYVSKYSFNKKYIKFSDVPVLTNNTLNEGTEKCRVMGQAFDYDDESLGMTYYADMETLSCSGNSNLIPDSEIEVVRE